MLLTVLAFAALYKLSLERLSFGSREQTLQASASVTLQQQGLVAALVARFECGLLRHVYTIPVTLKIVKTFFQVFYVSNSACKPS